MATLVLRAGKGSPLTNAEVDANFTNLNTEVAAAALTASWTGVTGKPATLSGYGITDAQPLDADLTAIAALAGTSGFLKKTAANTWALDTSTYLTEITSGQVTTALGFTPYNSTNPSGYITASASITGNAATATALQTARTIQGVSFNGSANITVATAGTGISVSGTAISIAAAYSPNTATELPTAQDLNTYQTAGFYYQTANAYASAGSNYPVAQAGSLAVQKSAGVTQQYYTYGTGDTEMYFRAFYNTVWGSWRRALTSANYNSYSPTLTGTGASGTWGISITGNAATVTNGLVSTGSYADPAWLTSVNYSKLTGTVPTWNQSTTGNAATATALQAARTIGGVSFNGTANINLPGVNAVGNQNTTGTAAGLTDDSSWMKSRGSVAQASVDTATSNGFYAQSNAGDSQGLLVFNAGGSLGPLQMTFTYGGLFQFRNKTDSATWTAWKTALTSANYTSYSPTLTGTGASGTWGISITGNAATATKLATDRTIGGVSFDGTSNINLPGVNTAGNQSTTGNAATATALQTARTISLSGDVIGSASFNGSANISITATVADNSHNHAFITSSAPSYVASDSLQYLNTNGSTTDSPTTDWWNVIRMGHGDPNTYYNNTLAMKMTGSNVGGLWGRTRAGGTAGAWFRFFDDNYHPNADVLTTARTINGVSFNGSADITVADSTKLPLSGGTLTGNLRVNSGIQSGADMARPLAQWSAASAATGMVYFELPGTTSNYGMVHAVIDIYEYNSNSVSTVIVGGHNWNGAWYNVAANVIGQTDKAVRLGVRGGKYVICIGTASSSWSYGSVVLRKIHNGGFYTGIMDMGAAFVAAITTTESLTSDTGDLRALRTPSSFNAGGAITQAGNQVLHAGNYTSYPIASSQLTGTIDNARLNGGTYTINVTGSSGSTTGNAATATTLQTARTIGGVSFNGSANINLPGVNAAGNQNTTGSAATLTTARTLTIGNTGKTFNGSANVGWTLAEIGALSTGGGTITTSGSSGSLIIQDTGASGANIRLIGNGATTPNKTIRAQSGLFQIINSAYTNPCMSVYDNGDLVMPGQLYAGNTNLVLHAGNYGSYVTTANTTNVLNATAGAAFGAVGTYVTAGRHLINTTTTQGTNVAGSQLKPGPGGAMGSNNTLWGTALTGTWKCMGKTSSSGDQGYGEYVVSTTLWLRIS